MGIPVVEPVVRVAVEPCALGVSLIVPILRIALEFPLVPLTFAGALAIWQ